MPSRHQAREMAFQLVYEWSLNEGSLYDADRNKSYWNERVNDSVENIDFYNRVLKGVADFLPQIDSRIESSLDNWKLSRLDQVDLAILRLGVFELLYDMDKDRPDDAVILNEAIEMAKKFGGTDSPAFINGVLDKIAKNISKNSNERV